MKPGFVAVILGTVFMGWELWVQTPSPSVGSAGVPSQERLDGSWEKVLSHSFSSTIPTLPKACVQSVALQQSQDLPGLHEELFVCLSPQL